MLIWKNVWIIGQLHKNSIFSCNFFRWNLRTTFCSDIKFWWWSVYTVFWIPCCQFPGKSWKLYIKTFSGSAHSPTHESCRPMCHVILWAAVLLCPGVFLFLKYFFSNIFSKAFISLVFLRFYRPLITICTLGDYTFIFEGNKPKNTKIAWKYMK